MDVYVAQLRLRGALLDRPVIRHLPARDLAAHLLLHLDSVEGCWAIATDWLRSELDCQRVDTGFGRPSANEYVPAFAEARHPDYDVPSFGGTVVDNRDPLMQAMWQGARPIVVPDVKGDRRITVGMRRRMSGARTRSKLGTALRSGRGAYALICADWTEHAVPRRSGLLDCFERTTVDVLSPIIATAMELQECRTNGSDRDGTLGLELGQAGRREILLQSLTASEAEVARLVARGLSYKEIANIRERSFSTIDHQLRSIRAKLGVPSTAQLVSVLAEPENDLGSISTRR